MNLSERTKLQVAQFERALARLHLALAENETEIVRDALIQRFEFTYEMAWKSLFRTLHDWGENVPEVVMPVLQAALKARLIDAADRWAEIREYRDKTSHTYDEKIAIDVAAFVRTVAVTSFDALLAKLKGVA